MWKVIVINIKLSLLYHLIEKDQRGMEGETEEGTSRRRREKEEEREAGDMGPNKHLIS